MVVLIENAGKMLQFLKTTMKVRCVRSERKEEVSLLCRCDVASSHYSIMAGTLSGFASKICLKYFVLREIRVNVVPRKHHDSYKIDILNMFGSACVFH